MLQSDEGAVEVQALYHPIHIGCAGAAGRRRGGTEDSSIKGVQAAQKSCKTTLTGAGKSHLQSDQEESDVDPDGFGQLCSTSGPIQCSCTTL